jgi:hypothetical protein
MSSARVTGLAFRSWTQQVEAGPGPPAGSRFCQDRDGPRRGGLFRPPPAVPASMPRAAARPGLHPRLAYRAPWFLNGPGRIPGTLRASGNLLVRCRTDDSRRPHGIPEEASAPRDLVAVRGRNRAAGRLAAAVSSCGTSRRNSRPFAPPAVEPLQAPAARRAQVQPGPSRGRLRTGLLLPWQGARALRGPVAGRALSSETPGLRVP